MHVLVSRSRKTMIRNTCFHCIWCIFAFVLNEWWGSSPTLTHARGNAVDGHICFESTVYCMYNKASLLWILKEHKKLLNYLGFRTDELALKKHENEMKEHTTHWKICFLKNWPVHRWQASKGKCLLSFEIPAFWISCTLTVVGKHTYGWRTVK